MDLHLEVIDQAPYTTLLRLTYFFPFEDERVHRLPQADPDALLRAYHDARQVEVIDLRTLKPLDSDTVLASVAKTGRLLVTHAANRLAGIGAEIAAVVAEEAEV